MADIPTEEQQAERKKNLATIASKNFDYHGEVPEEKKDQPKEPAEAKPELVDKMVISEETTDGALGDIAESKGEEAADVEEEIEGAEPTEEEAAEEEVQTFEAISEQLGLDEEAAANTKFKVKVNGVEGEVSLKDLTASYQTQDAAEKILDEAKAKRDTMLTESTTAQQALQEQFGIAARMIEGVEKALTKEENAINWVKLEQDDPAAYAAKRLRFNDRHKAIEQDKIDARNDYQKSQEQLNEQNQKKITEFKVEQQKHLIEKIPEWKDKEKAAVEIPKLTAYLEKQGVSAVEQENLFDHRVYVVARKAMLYDELMAKADPKKKKFAKVPKTMKPGAAKTAGEHQIKLVKDAEARHAQEGTIESAMAVRRAKKKAARQ